MQISKESVGMAVAWGGLVIAGYGYYLHRGLSGGLMWAGMLLFGAGLYFAKDNE